MEENFYLESLNKLAKELKLVMSKKKDYTPVIYNCILAGIIIRMNSIIDQCMLDFHSDSFKEAAEAIYNSRQILVHYSDYRTFEDLDDISSEVLDRFYEAYPTEREYFDDILNYKDVKEHNVVIPKSKQVVYDEFTNSYIFISDGVEIAVSKEKVTKIQDLVKRRDLAYIVNCDSDMNYFYKDEDGETMYQELKGHEALQDFFKAYFTVTEVDFNKHKECIKDILNKFYKSGNYNATYVMTRREETNSKKKQLYLESSKTLDKYFNEGVVFSQFLDSRTYSNIGIPSQEFFDYKFIREQSEFDLERNITKRDYFFVVKTISMFDNLNKELKNAQNLDELQKEKLEMAMLINWADHTFRNMSDEFVECNEEFAKLHFNLLSYRTFFAHNVLQLKQSASKKLLEEFYELAKGYVSVLSSLHVPNLDMKMSKNEVDFIAIERMPPHFVNSKHEQYIQVDPTTYIGDKLFYSTRGSKYRKIIGLVPVDKTYSLRGTYYEKKGDNFVAKTFKTPGGRKRNLLVSRVDYSKGREVNFDVNIDDLLYIYAAYKDKIKEYPLCELYGSHHKKVVYFPPSAENNYKAHAIELEEIISDYYQQRYLPFELVTNTDVITKKTDDGKIVFAIVDLSKEEQEEIAYIVDVNDLQDLNVELDSKGFFTINETIHNFTEKRRLKK